MMSYLEGTVTTVSYQHITLALSGFGFSVQVPRESAFVQGQQYKIACYLHWNSEQGPSLFGFSSVAEKMLFLLIIGCSGLGPKIGLALLAAMTPSQLYAAVSTADITALSKVPGIGTKKAEQLILHLKTKIAKLELNTGEPESQQAQQWREISQVLESLHYSRQEISAALASLQKEHAHNQALSFDQLMRHSLSFLAKKG